MDNTRKIVFVVLAIYLVLGLQFFVENNTVILPINFNPIVLWLASVFAIITSIGKKSFSINLTYCIGLTIYAFLSERTLNICFNYTEFNWIRPVIESPFLRLFQIFCFLAVLLGLMLGYCLKNRTGFIPLVLFLLSCGFGVFNIETIYTLLFSAFVLSFLCVNVFVKNDQLKNKYSGLTYQLLLFALLENAFILLY